MLRGFEGRLLSRLMGFNLEYKISNVRLKKLTGLGDVNKEVKKDIGGGLKGKTTKTSAEMDGSDIGVETDPEVHGKEPMRHSGKVQIGQALR
jgi:hypothetical protein